MSQLVEAWAIGLLGLALGALHAYGLWWTVRALPAARYPATLLLVSFAVRASISLGPVVFLARDAPMSLVIALAAVFLGRWIFVSLLGNASVGPHHPAGGARS